jgi:penicillin-binding protein 1A
MTFLSLVALLAATVLWLSLAVPVAKSAEPMVPGRLVLLTRDGTFIAEDGYLMDAPVEIAKLPPHVAQAFYAIEDRRFPSHIGFDPIGIARALVNNLTGGGRQGGSTITQQLAKNAYLRDPKTGNPYPGYSRKLREMAIAVWLETWLTKDQILERYLSMVPFGERVYGLRAASLFYFHRQPERLTVAQAVMLAGLVQAPSRYDPSVKDVSRARKRALKVALAMQAEGYLPPGPAGLPAPAQLDIRQQRRPRTSFYFADWVMGDARARVGRSYARHEITTTLDARLQTAAQELVRAAPYPGTDIALVAMRPNGEVVAMIGGRDYAKKQFNIAVDGRRQPGSTFKLFTYVTALQGGKRPSALVSDAPLTTGPYQPTNADGRYAGDITLSEAFARSSNVAAVRLFEELGPDNVIDTARAFGFEGAVNMDPSLALGTAETSLLSMTAAYAGIAAGKVAVAPFGLPPTASSQAVETIPLDGRVVGDIKAMLAQVIASGTGQAAQLPVPAYGKTGTTQNNRDAWFIGFAGELVVGVWFGDDSGAANPAISGGDAAARLWREFMLRAIAADRLMAPRDPGPRGGRGGGGTSNSVGGGGTGRGSSGGSGSDGVVPVSGLRGDDGQPVTYVPDARVPARREQGFGAGAGATGRGGAPGTTVRPTASSGGGAPGDGIIFDRDGSPPADRPGIRGSTPTPQRATGSPLRPQPPARVQQQQTRRPRQSATGDEDEDFTIDCGDDTC